MVIRIGTGPSPAALRGDRIDPVTTSSDLAAGLAIRLASAQRGDVDAVVVEALAALAQLAGAPRAYITLYHDDGTFENSHEWTEGGVVPQLPAIKRLRSEDYAYSYHRARRGEIFAVPDLSALPDAAMAEKRSFSSFGVRAVLQVPIVVDGEGLGLIGFNHWTVVEPWSDELIDTVRLVGQVIGGVLVRERAESSMRRAYEEAERANKAKDEMLAHLSHELRTPLHAILGYAELMELDERSDRDRESLFQIQYQGRNLLSMVEDLLSLADDTDSPEEGIEVGPMVSSIVESLEPVGASRSIQLTTSDDIGDVLIHTEPGRLRQVMYCVLSGGINAVGSGGEISVDVAENAPHDDPAIRVRLAGENGIAAHDVVMPMARALIHGRGTIDVEHVDGGAVDVVVRFGAGD